MIDWLTGREKGGRPWETRSACPNDIGQLYWSYVSSVSKIMYMYHTFQCI